MGGLSDNKAISVQLNLTGTELGNKCAIGGGGGGGVRTPSNFAAFGHPLTVTFIEMFYTDCSYLSNAKAPPFWPLKK